MLESYLDNLIRITFMNVIALNVSFLMQIDSSQKVYLKVNSVNTGKIFTFIPALVQQIQSIQFTAQENAF